MTAVLVIGYLVAVNLFAVIVTVTDKRAAKRHRLRVPEATLLWIGFFGGALGMWLTMKRIRHKTRKAVFMVGLPMMIVLHSLAAGCLWLWYKGVLV